MLDKLLVVTATTASVLVAGQVACGYLFTFWGLSDIFFWVH